MENNFSYTHSYAESGDSSPRSREIDFENSNSSWDTNNIDHPNYKVKFMCSYGGKILPRPHDNQLAYIGGETKILAVDRSIKLPQLLSKLSGITDFDPTDISFKYQLPGEDLDALISVTTDDDLQHMMQEYDRIVRTSAKPARLRLFMFVPTTSTLSSFGMNDSKSDKDRFVEALNTGPVVVAPPSAAPPPPPSKVDFLFGLENKVRDHQAAAAAAAVENDFVKLRINEEYVRRNDDNTSYLQNKPEKMHALLQQQMQIPASFWPPEKQIPVTGVYPASNMSPDQQQQVYMIPSPAPPANMYHAPMGRPVTGPTGQGYYAMQRMQPEVYREQQPVYNVVTQAMPQPTQVVPKTTSFPVTSGAVMDAGFGQVAYDSAGGRQVFYTAPGGVVSQPVAVQPYQPMAAAAAYGGDMRAVAGNFNQEGSGKVVQVKVSQASG